MQSLKEKDRSFIWHPYTAFLPDPNPIVITRGEGIYLEDESGNRYIDAISSWWVNIHGHGHPYIAEKIYRQALQLEQVIFAGFTHEPAISLAERLLGILPGQMAKIFYSDNGSTAVEVAVKMCLQYWWNEAGGAAPARKRVLAFRDAYHGDTFGSMSVSDRGLFTRAFEDKLFDVLFIETPTAANIDTLEALIREQGNTIAAFIYEPLLQGAGGMKVYNAAHLDRLLAVCREMDVLCIADEVMTGFGRTGRLFASDYCSGKPDLVCLSKGLTGGTMALGVTACNEKIVRAFESADRHKTFFHGHSFTANPIACAAALASLDLLQEPGCLSSIAAISTANKTFLDILSGYASVLQARSCGTILAFEFVSGNYDYLSSISREVTTFALERGVYLRPLGNTIYIMPPYCVTPEELQKVYQVILQFLEQKSTVSS